jgi:hypothetical protein
MNDREPLAFGGLGEPLIERDEGQRSWMALGGHESRRKLKGVGSTERMDAQEPDRRVADGRDGLHLLPGPDERCEPRQGLAGPGQLERALPLQAGDRRDTLDLGGPPGDDVGVPRGSARGERLCRVGR